MSQGYEKIKLGQLRQAIKDGDEGAAAYVAEAFKPIEEALSGIGDVGEFVAEPPRRQDAALKNAFAEMTSDLEARRHAAVEREQQLLDGIGRLRELAEASVLGEMRSEARERRTVRLTSVAVVFGGVGAAAGVLALVVAVAH